MKKKMKNLDVSKLFLKFGGTLSTTKLLLNEMFYLRICVLIIPLKKKDLVKLTLLILKVKMTSFNPFLKNHRNTKKKIKISNTTLYLCRSLYNIDEKSLYSFDLSADCPDTVTG